MHTYNILIPQITVPERQIPSVQMPLFNSLALLSKSANESTVNTFLGPEAIWLSSEASTSFPIPNTNTAAPLLWRRDEAHIKRRICSFVCCLLASRDYKNRLRSKNRQRSNFSQSEYRCITVSFCDPLTNEIYNLITAQLLIYPAHVS